MMKRNNPDNLHGHLWTISEFCEYARINRSRAYYLINTGKISYLRTNGDTGHIRFTFKHISDWVKENTISHER